MAESMEDYIDRQMGIIAFYVLEGDYSSVIKAIMKVAENRGFNLFAAVHEKRVYNAQRLDHKRENRAKENGKKF
jgi:hypothetical protein